MSPLRRRRLLQGAALGALARAGGLAGAAGAAGTADLPAADADADAVRPGRVLRFPRDHGAHPGARIEWWYATGWLGTPEAPTHGFQITFFRSRTGLASGNPSRFAARQLLFAHAALTALQAGQHRHDQRIARWNGEPDARPDVATVDDGAVTIGDWSLRHDGRHWQVLAPARGFSLRLALAATQPLLLQGDAGFSRKGPQPSQASHYYSEPQLAVSGTIEAEGRPVQAGGRAWLDHEWSDEILHPDAVGWDWIGINGFDGSALTAFVLRRRDGSALWAGGSFRAAGGPVQRFAPQDVAFTPGRRWRSPATRADYPVQWSVQTPAGTFTVRALLDAQELGAGNGTGAVYWEGLSELLDADGRRVGLGYLEMTGYAAALRL